MRPEETEIVGNWKVVDARVTKDEQAQRIEVLIHQHLKPVQSKGWERLLQDPADGRLWELTYPSSEMHGGGPPKLTMMTEEQARRKYEF